MLGCDGYIFPHGSLRIDLLGRLLLKLDNRAFGNLILPTRLERPKLTVLNPVVDRPEVNAVPLRDVFDRENPFHYRTSLFFCLRSVLRCVILC